jgi:hypothetical protein
MKNDRLLGMMRFWLIGTFLIICAATTTYLVVLTHESVLKALEISWPVWGVTAVLCVAWYYIYKMYLKRKD